MAQVLLQCDVAILRLSNLVDDSDRIFVRYYVGVDSGKRIRIDSHELLPSAGGELCWDERASLERRGGTEAIGEVRVVFELRSRRSASVCGVRMAVGSRLIGRGEVALSDVVGSADVSVERWVRLDSLTTTRSKPLALLVRMGVRVKDSEAAGRRRIHECNCESCGWVGTEEDMFLNANVTK